MFEKNGSYYADWRDAKGQRIRKAFTTKRAALKYEAEQKSIITAPKTNGARKPLRPSSRLTSPRAEPKPGRVAAGQRHKR